MIRTRTLLGAGCPVCAAKAAAPDYNLVTEFPAIAEEWDFFRTSVPRRFLDRIPIKLYGGGAEGVAKDGRPKSSIGPERGAVAETVS